MGSLSKRIVPSIKKESAKTPGGVIRLIEFIPQTTRTEDIRVYHQHIDPGFAEQDLNCLLPIERLDELVEMKKVGRAASSHYSIMGYILDPEELLKKTVPAIIEHLQADQVDVVVLIPA